MKKFDLTWIKMLGVLQAILTSLLLVVFHFGFRDLAFGTLERLHHLNFDFCLRLADRLFHQPLAPPPQEEAIFFLLLIFTGSIQWAIIGLLIDTVKGMHKLK